jgi:hypothetical protein
MIVIALGWFAEGRNARRKTQLYHAHPGEFDEAASVRVSCAVNTGTFLRGEVKMRGSILFLACLLIVFPCQAGTITVDDDGPADFNNIQAAINAAGNMDIVVVSPGTYTGTGNRDIDFLGKAITVRSTDPNDLTIVAATIIDCNGTPEDPHRGFHFHSGEDADSLIVGLTIMQGHTDYGGGILCFDSSPTISHCVIRDNSTYSAWGHAGGGIYCDSSGSPAHRSPTITRCILRRNTAYFGGGMYNVQSSPALTNCIIADNQTWSSGAGTTLTTVIRF